MTLKIIFWDVQHGSATYIRTPGGKHIVQDLGTGSYKHGTFNPLLHLKSKLSVNQLDQVIITHPHGDHIDDILNFDELNPKVLLHPKHLEKDTIMQYATEDNKLILEKYFEINDRYSHPIDPSNDPTLASNNGGVEIKEFIPSQCSQSNLNNHSIVTVLSYAGQKIILPGDNEPASWNELLEDSNFVDAIKNADILLASHHGRESGFCQAIFDHFKPRITIISDGRSSETSATDKYRNVSRGWTVHHRSGKKSEERYCLSTRNDGTIEVDIGYNGDGPFIQVKVD